MSDRGPNLWGIWGGALGVGFFMGALLVATIASNVGVGCR